MKYFIIAGEASGDLHASHLIASLKQQDPQAEFRFLGGDLMAAQAGVQPIIYYRDNNSTITFSNTPCRFYIDIISCRP